jgi:hypothetical protein
MQAMIEKQLPFAQHVYLAPTKNLSVELKSHSYDVLMTYSLGSFLYLRGDVNGNAKPVGMIAPIVDLCKKECGGRVAKFQLLYLRNWLKRAPLEVVSHFYKLIGAPFCDEESLTQLPYALDDLAWGLDTFLEGAPNRVAEFSKAWVGSGDPLIHGQKVVTALGDHAELGNQGHFLSDYLSLVAGWLVEKGEKRAVC